MVTGLVRPCLDWHQCQTTLPTQSSQWNHYIGTAGVPAQRSTQCRPATKLNRAQKQQCNASSLISSCKRCIPGKLLFTQKAFFVLFILMSSRQKMIELEQLARFVKSRLPRWSVHWSITQTGPPGYYFIFLLASVALWHCTFFGLLNYCMFRLQDYMINANDTSPFGRPTQFWTLDIWFVFPGKIFFA